MSTGLSAMFGISIKADCSIIDDTSTPFWEATCSGDGRCRSAVRKSSGKAGALLYVDKRDVAPRSCTNLLKNYI